MTEKLEKQQKLEQEKKRRQKHQVIVVPAFARILRVGHLHDALPRLLSGVPQQYPAARQGLQRVSPLRVRQNPETHQIRCHVAHQHGAGAEEGDGEDREGEDEEADGEKSWNALELWVSEWRPSLF